MSVNICRHLGVAVLLGLSPATAISIQPGAAAHLHVDGGVAQYWEFEVEPPTPPVGDELSACGPLEQYDVVITGTPGDDVLGSPEPPAGNQSQLVIGLGGNDVLYGGHGADCLVGGDGDDQLFGNNATDILVGGAGNDHLDGGNADDVLDGGSDADTCIGGRGEDTMVNCEFEP